MLKNRLLLVALSVSVLFHISMVTLFSIVFEFPVKRIDYYNFRIMSESRVAAAGPRPTASQRVASLPTLEDPLRETGLGDLDLDESPGWEAGLPAIELPRLEFAEMEMLEAREEGLTIRSRLAEFLESPLSEPWGDLGRGLERLGGALSPSRLFGREEEEEVLTPAKPKLVARPAEGFEAYVEWMSDPRDRELLFSPPIDALFNVHPEDLTEPITLVFRVNPQGEVIEVLTPLPDEAGIVVSAARALTTYRFAPLDEENGRDQHGTLLITPAREDKEGLP